MILSYNLQINKVNQNIIDMFLNNTARSKTHNFDENLELQEMLAYDSKNDINITELRDRSLSGDLQNQLQSSSTQSKNSLLYGEFHFLKINGEEQIFQGNCTQSISSSYIRRPNFHFQEPNNQIIKTSFTDTTEKFEKVIQMRDQQIKEISLKLQIKDKQISDLKQLTQVLREQLRQLKATLSQAESQKKQLLDSLQSGSKSSLSLQISFHQKYQMNSPKQKIGKNNITFNKVSPIYKSRETSFDEEQKNKMKKQYEKIIECKDKIIDSLELEIKSISLQLNADKQLTTKILELQQQLTEKEEKIKNLEIKRENEIKMIELSTQDQEVEKQTIQMQSNQFFLKQLRLKQRKIQQLCHEIELKNSTLNYTQNQMMKIEIDRINTEIQKQFYKQKVDKFQLQQCSPSSQEFKRSQKNENPILKVPNNCSKQFKFAPQMLSPKQTVDVMIKIIKKAIKSQNIRLLLQKSPNFLESINELLQKLL